MFGASSPNAGINNAMMAIRTTRGRFLTLVRPFLFRLTHDIA
jgi:hypothetical protein